jgi:hypothetical protein
MLYALNSDPDGRSQILWEDGERVFCRGWRTGDDGNRNAACWWFCLPPSTRRARSSIALLGVIERITFGPPSFQQVGDLNTGCRCLLFRSVEARSLASVWPYLDVKFD